MAPADALPPHPFGDVLGLEFTSIEDGRSHCRLEVTDELLNPHGVVHGGVLYSMADTGMGAALYPGLAENELPSTIDITIRYYRPVERGTIDCETTVEHRGGSVAYLQSVIAQDDRPVAQASGSYFVAVVD